MAQTSYYKNPEQLHGPRPKVKRVGFESGVPVYRCESPQEMRVRVERLRRPRDKRSAERILLDLDDTWARAAKSYRKER